MHLHHESNLQDRTTDRQTDRQTLRQTNRQTTQPPRLCGAFSGSPQLHVNVHKQKYH